MPSKGSGADITRQEADDLLQRLITESIKVRAVFGGLSVTASTSGAVVRLENGGILVSEGKSATDSSMLFGTSDVAAFTYGDSRSFPSVPRIPELPELASVLCFRYPDGTTVALFEIAED